ncbi:MAG: hypothetical protein HYU68_10775 [Bacteroidetes bacterium]|nr:hypothetical protein [Bacteroidota bacterium]
METKQSLGEKILHITLKIKEQYPELGKYLDEMPITIPDKKYPIITSKILQDYYNSLTSLLDNYLLEEFCNNEMN